MAERGGRARRPARPRSATESLLSIVLVLEALLVFFVTLVVFALDRVSPQIALASGGILFVVLLVLARLQRYAWANVVGHGVQLLLIATGVLEPLMYVIGVLFAALWIYCFVTGRRLDKRNAALSADGSTTGDRTAQADPPDQNDLPDQTDSSNQNHPKEKS